MTTGANPGAQAATSPWPEPLIALVRSLPEYRRLWVAFSGGLDSTVLLHLAVAARATAELPTAIHVNHQLQPNADAMAQHCQDVAATLGVPVQVHRVSVVASDTPAGGLEEAARNARYRVFEEVLGPGDLLLMAHHADDQAETLVFRLLRGTGVRGLAGMPRQRQLGQGMLYRPLLSVSRDVLAQAARAAGVTWKDDPSNADPRFDRNFLRHQALPVLRSRWPDLNRRLAATAEACREAAVLADALAERQWRECTEDGQTLAVAGLGRLPVAEQKNLMQWWIRRGGWPVPAIRGWPEVLGQLLAAAPDRAPELVGEGFRVRRYQGRLHLVAEQPSARPVEATLCPGQPLRWGDWQLILQPAGDQPAPSIQVRARLGGERFRPQPGGPLKTLKNWLQETAVPPWERARLPLVFEASEGAESLVAVGDFWCSEQYSGSAPAAGWRLVVERDCD
ncbi:tRNA lysidine(34) synthetase TilS [Marinobacter sp. C2H3]|uniref:tRNA lysidine(34) synthetase TilS n=1 Tax=Marinobacter sp. C2H3 TaxID=3119003 RepID=UPI00300E7AED